MELLTKIQDLLKTYHIKNDQLACDIAIMVKEAEIDTIKQEMEDRNDDSARYEFHDYAFNGRKIKHGFNHKGEML